MMRMPALIILFISVLPFLLFQGCDYSASNNPANPGNTGTILLKSKGYSHYYMLDANNTPIETNGFLTNAEYPIPAGTYAVNLNGSMFRSVVVQEGKQTLLEAATLTFSKFTSSNIVIGYSDGAFSSFTLRQSSIDLAPGVYSMEVNGSRVNGIRLVDQQEYSLPTGLLRIDGCSLSRITLFDSTQRNLGSYSGNTELMLFPGTYSTNLNGSRVNEIKIVDDQLTSLNAGSVWVKGKGFTAFAVYDSTGRRLSAFTTGTQVDLFAGRYTIELTAMKQTCYVLPGITKVLESGQLWVKGMGVSTYAVICSTSQAISSKMTGEQIELFPGNYRVKIIGCDTAVGIWPSVETSLSTGTLTVRDSISTASLSLYNLTGILLGTGLKPNSPIDLLAGTYRLDDGSGSPTIARVVDGQNTNIFRP